VKSHTVEAGWRRIPSNETLIVIERNRGMATSILVGVKIRLICHLRHKQLRLNLLVGSYGLKSANLNPFILECIH